MKKTIIISTVVIIVIAVAAYFFYPKQTDVVTITPTPTPTPTPTSTPTPTITTGTIQGQALLGPTCPVMRDPPDPQCADKPYQTSLVVTSANGSSVIKQFLTDTQGMFSIDIPPGDYAIRSVSGSNPFPRCSSEGTVHVNQGKITKANISCDTGIR